MFDRDPDPTWNFDKNQDVTLFSCGSNGVFTGLESDPWQESVREAAKKILF